MERYTSFIRPLAVWHFACKKLAFFVPCSHGVQIMKKEGKMARGEKELGRKGEVFQGVETFPRLSTKRKSDRLKLPRLGPKKSQS